MDGIRCPSTSTEIQQKSESLQCSTNSQYHCLRNEMGKLVEICIESSWIQSGYCAEYNAKAMKLDAMPCDRNLGICPSKTYSSDNVIAYSACVQPQKPSIVSWQFSTTPDLMSTFDDGNENFLTAFKLLWIIVPFLVFLVFIGIFFYICRRRRRRTDSRNVNTDELTNLVQHPSTLSTKKLKFFDNSHYTELEVTETLREWIKSGDSVLIVGNHGSGKTSLAWNTCAEFHKTVAEDKVYQVLIFTNFEEIPTKFHSKKKTLLLLDDCFEIWSYYPDKFDSYIKRLNNDLEDKARSGTIQLIITMSSVTFKSIHSNSASTSPNVKNFAFCKQLNMSGENWHSEQDIRNLCLVYQIDVEENPVHHIRDKKYIIQQLTPTYYIIGAPLSLYIFSRKKNQNKKAGDFFQNPWKQVIEDMNQLCTSEFTSEQSIYCTLIYTMLQGGIINMTKYDKELLRAIGKVSGISQPTLNADHYLLRKRNDGRCEFIHELILRLLFKAFGNEFPDIILDHCNWKTIFQYLRTHDKNWVNFYRKDGLLVIEKSVILKRLADKVKKHDIDLTGHIILRDKNFCEKYLS